MHIRFVEVSNFRKLLAVRVDFTETTTLFVGANNSGKTSAMEALRYFLVDGHFSINDLTLSHWDKINIIGKTWEGLADAAEAAATASLAEWHALLPTLDLWFHVENDEIHHVSRLLPTLDWEGGLLGVRLRFEPKDLATFAADYFSSFSEAKAIKAEAEAALEGEDCDVKLWPQTLLEYLERKLSDRFSIKVYPLDPTKCVDPENGIAKPQPLPAGSEAVEDNPLGNLIRVNEINAQRGLGHSSRTDDSAAQRDPRGLTDQAKSYYAAHLDPTDRPQASDLVALRAIERAEELFDKTLAASFTPALEEVGGLGYPGVTDPQIKISARLRPADSLNHDSAVQYEVAAVAGDGEGAVTTILRLPEHYNGLGYQNLILMVFRLMGYRDGWMRVGKMSRSEGAREKMFPPLHLVLIEEPEAHLHAQVQQVFIRKAYSILRKHEHLGDNNARRTQLIVSTHSSHVAHEAKFSWLRYFRRLPAAAAGTVPTSTVINLSDVFGPDKETEQFDTRYLRATHCDLFFAEAAILVEGPAERMLVPHFVRSHFEYLTQCYLSLLEIGGSHAHRLKPLIEKLGLLTLVVTDLDASLGVSSAQPARGAGQVTGNATLKTWLPKKVQIDELLDLEDAQKVAVYDPIFAVRAAYQYPVNVDISGSSVEVIPSTFEDALAFANLATFGALAGTTGLMEKFRKAISDHKTGPALSKALYDHLHSSGAKKAEFALDLLALEDPEKLEVPKYLSEGLSWLQDQLRGKHVEVLPVAEDGNAAGVAA